MASVGSVEELRQSERRLFPKPGTFPKTGVQVAMPVRVRQNDIGTGARIGDALDRGPG